MALESIDGPDPDRLWQARAQSVHLLIVRCNHEDVGVTYRTLSAVASSTFGKKGEHGWLKCERDLLYFDADIGRLWAA